MWSPGVGQSALDHFLPATGGLWPWTHRLSADLPKVGLLILGCREPEGPTFLWEWLAGEGDILSSIATGEMSSLL